MKLTSVQNKVTKAGWVVTVTEGRYKARRPDNLYTIEWLQNGRGEEATCLKVRRLTDEDDMQSDYHAGTYCDSITQALRWVTDWNVSAIADAKFMAEHNAKLAGAV